MNAPTGPIVLLLNAVLLDVLLLWGDSRAAITVDGYAGGLGRIRLPPDHANGTWNLSQSTDTWCVANIRKRAITRYRRTTSSAGTLIINEHRKTQKRQHRRKATATTALRKTEARQEQLKPDRYLTAY